MITGNDWFEALQDFRRWAGEMGMTLEEQDRLFMKFSIEWGGQVPPSTVLRNIMNEMGD